MSKALLVAIAVVALCLRLLNAVFIPWQGGDLVISDMKGYDRAAVALLQQQPLAVHTAERYLFHPLGSDTYHPPGYYYFLAGVYAAFGHDYMAVRIVQACVGTVTCMLIYLMGKYVFSAGAGLLAAAFAAVYPPLVFYGSVLLSETLSTCLLAGGVCLLLRSTQAHRRYGWELAASGLMLGLAALTRSVLLVAVPVALLWHLTIGKRWPGWREAVVRVGILFLPCALIITPITLRNRQIHGEMVPISTNGGVNFFLGHGGSTAWKNQIRNIPPDYQEGDSLIGVSALTATQEEALFYRLGWDYVRQHPVRTVLDIPAKLRSMYWDSDFWPASDVQAHLLRTADTLMWKLLVLPLSLASILILRGRRFRQAALICGLAFSSATIPIVFWAQTRFRIPFVPLFITLAAGAAFEIYSRFRGTGPSALGAILAA